MDGFESDSQMSSDNTHVKCNVNNDKNIVNSVVKNVFNNIDINNDSNKSLKNDLNNDCNESIECIQLYDSEDDDSEAEPKHKKVKVDDEGQGLCSLPSPPNSPLTSTNNCDYIENNGIRKDSNQRVSNNCINTCVETYIQTNNDLSTSFEFKQNINVSDECIQTNTNTNTLNICNIKQNEQNIDFKDKKEKNDSNETLVKKLFAICLEKRYEIQSKNSCFEQSLIDKIENMNIETQKRNEQFLKINEKLHWIQFNNKETQVNISLNENASINSEDNCLKVENKLNNELNTENKSEVQNDLSSKSSFLKNHLINSLNITKNDKICENKNNIEDKPKNSPSIAANLKNGFKKDILTENKLNENLKLKNSSQKESASLAKNLSSNNDNNSDDDIVILSDDEEEGSSEPIKALKTTGLSSAKSSLYNQCLPQPKLSISVRNSNKTNNLKNSTKGQNNTSTERKFNHMVSPTEKVRKPFEPIIID